MFFSQPPSPLPASPYPEGRKVIILGLFAVDNVLLPSAEGLVFGFGKFAVF